MSFNEQEFRIDNSSNNNNSSSGVQNISDDLVAGFLLSEEGSNTSKIKEYLDSHEVAYNDVYYDAHTDTYNITYTAPNGEEMLVNVPGATHTLTPAEVNGYGVQIVNSMNSANAALTAAENNMANAEASNTVIAAVLNSLANAPTAKQDFTITAEDYAALRAKYPNLSDAQLTNLIANSSWVKDFGANVSTTPTTSLLKGATLEELINNAEEGNDAAQDTASIKLTKQRNELLKSIARDPALYDAVVKQLRADTAGGRVVGQRAANLLDTARTKNTEYKSAADALYEATGGVDAESLAGQLRSSVYNNLTGSYGSYIDQQLNKLASDTNAQATDVDKLITVLSLINQGLQSEDATIRRQAEDELTRIQNEASSRESKASMESEATIAASSAAVDNAANTANLATTVVNSGDGSTTPVTSNTYQSYGTGLYNKPDLTTAPYIDETLYNALLGEDVTKFLEQDAFNRYTKPKSQADLAQAYGLEDLLDVNNVVNNYQQYQQQANEASDKVFNDAQRAYVMAVAAGDAKTVEQLTRLAQQAGVGRKNIYGATALANQFAQQNANALVSDSLYYAALQQQAANKASMSNAAATGQAQWNAWVGNGGANSANNGFNQSYVQQNNNAAQALGAYGDLMSSAMSNQTSFNDVFSNLTNNSNTVLTNYANSLNKLNSAGATNNTLNSATIAGIQNTLQTQKQINDNTIANGGR